MTGIYLHTNLDPSMHGRRLLLSRTSVAGAWWRSSVAEVCVEPGSAMMLMCSSVVVFCGSGVGAKNLCQSLILTAIKVYTPWMPVWSNWSSFCGRFSRILLRSWQILLRSITLDQSIGDTRPRSCKTCAANTAADLSAKLVQLQALTSEGRDN